MIYRVKHFSGTRHYKLRRNAQKRVDDLNYRYKNAFYDSPVIEESPTEWVESPDSIWRVEWSYGGIKRYFKTFNEHCDAIKFLNSVSRYSPVLWRSESWLAVDKAAEV